MGLKREEFMSHKVSFGGFISLLTVVSLYMTSLLPTLKLFFFALSTLFLFVMVMEFGVGYAFMTFVSSSFLGIILVPNKIILIPYIIFFGYYGIIKYLIEKINNIVLEWIFKITLFNIFTYLSFIIAKSIFVIQINIDLPFWIIVILFQIVFIVYDYCYSLSISYYKKYIQKKIINNRR